MNTNATLSLPLDFALDPADDPSPGAVWASVFASKHPGMTFEQAMLDPILAHGINQVAQKRAQKLAKLGVVIPEKDCG